MSANKCEGCGNPAAGTDLDDVPLCDACGNAFERDVQEALARPCPPAPGPGFDAEGFVLRVMKAGAEYGIPEVTVENLDRLKEILDRFASELRSHLATGAADDGEPVTLEWLASLPGRVKDTTSKDTVLIQMNGENYLAIEPDFSVAIQQREFDHEDGQYINVSRVDGSGVNARKRGHGDGSTMIHATVDVSAALVLLMTNDVPAVTVPTHSARWR